MTILKCSATTCAYNEDMLCSRGEINVMGDSAKSSEETSCGSFRIRPNKKTVREFHDCLFEEYRELLSGERNVLFRMKELWSYMAVNFTNYEKYAKKIKKSQHLSEYSSVVSSLFAEQDLID